MTNKQLISEIEKWRLEGLVNENSADALKARYSKNSKSILSVVFSVIGCLLIAAGIVLLLGWNWSSLPLLAQTVFAMLPTVLSVFAAYYVLLRRSDSLIWREGVAVFWVVSVFASVFLVSGLYDSLIDYWLQMVIGTVLVLPVMFIMRAVTPLPLYFAATLAWLNQPGPDYRLSLLIMLTLFALGLLVNLVPERTKDNWRADFCRWISFAAGVPAVILICDLLDFSFVPMLSAYFIVIFAMSDVSGSFVEPKRTLGAIGCSVLTLWTAMYLPDIEECNALNSAIVLLALVMALITVLTRRRSDIEGMLFLAFSVVVCVIGVFHGYHSENELQLIALFAAFSAGICLVVRGTRLNIGSVLNLGLIQLCAVIVSVFFGISSSSLLRGIAFLFLGAGFLTANVVMLRHRKTRLPSDEDSSASPSVTDSDNSDAGTEDIAVSETADNGEEACEQVQAVTTQANSEVKTQAEPKTEPLATTEAKADPKPVTAAKEPAAASTNTSQSQEEPEKEAASQPSASGATPSPAYASGTSSQYLPASTSPISQASPHASLSAHRHAVLNKHRSTPPQTPQSLSAESRADKTAQKQKKVKSEKSAPKPKADPQAHAVLKKKGGGVK